MVRRFRGSFAVCALLIAYASLYPFIPLRWPADGSFGLFFVPRYIPGFDVWLNAMAYMPFGALACLAMRHEPTDKAPILRATLAAFGFSLAMEMLQLFVPFRVASIADIAANTAGAFAGALIFVEPVRSLVTQPLAVQRERFVIPGAWGDAGLVLVVLWLIAQFNPALPFFEAGNISSGEKEAVALRALQATAVALSVCGFGLFISAVLKGPGGALRSTLLLLTMALWLKFVMASVMLQPHVYPDWETGLRMVGLIAGIGLFVPMRHFSRTARVYLAILLILAGALFSKIFGSYSALDELLRLFNWPHGQLASFATLTRFLHEVWPLAALGWLVALFIGKRHDPVR
ncbi:VanZ family protein [Usitatibacter palustris]|uniref:VanZ-like domain-containing protein n=1 Tax=Usitatibacter palustris TaxID=2732487 RepID=A0A6M4HAF0_9PROT|nr:VanZ family protein [Usitatibacter palustris]QJR16779.1 hypothetical protein DSM104440_03615 [Usitatibacter palustris]